MNENIDTTVAADPVDVLADTDPGEALASDPEAFASTVEVIQVMVEERPFLTTDFANYTVAEGLLLMILLTMVVKFCVGLLKEGFSWLFS